MIRIFTKDFTFITELDAYISLMWIRRWHKPGEFQLVVNPHLPNMEELVEGRIISLGNNKSGIISHIEENTSSSGKGSDSLIVKGFDLKGMLIKRITIPPAGSAYDSYTANAETIMKNYVNNNAITTTPERIIENLSLSLDLERGESFYYQTRYKNLADEIEKLSINSGIGWDILYQNGIFTFDVVEGKDLTNQQALLPPVIFSIEFDNISAQKSIESSLGYKNVALVAGQGEGAAREVTIVGNHSGLDRSEIYIDARDIKVGENLGDRGNQKLSEYSKIESFEAEVLSYGPFVYGEDWDLGDIVTVQNTKKTKTLHLRVTEVTEVLERSGYKLTPTFGQPLPTIAEKIKREMDEPISEGGTEGTTGAPGTDGAGLDFLWQDTSLGVKKDSEVAYQYTELKGDQGAKGDPGVQGPAGTVETYTHDQISPSLMWTITHNLGKYPHVAIVDSSGNVVYGDVNHVNINVLEIRFNIAFSGKANII